MENKIKPKQNLLKTNSDLRDHFCPPNQENSQLIAINGVSRQGISKWEKSYLNEKFSHPPSPAFLRWLPELARRKRPLWPHNFWSETFWGILKVTHSPRGMVSHFFRPPFFVVYFPLYTFLFLLQLFWSQYHSDFITIISLLWTSPPLGGREPLWRW